jgi:vancomycin permeability regulator SanA
MIFWPLKLVFKIFSALLSLLLLYLAVTFVQIWLTGQDHTVSSAQAILVFGTTEDNGRPSPELRDRLDQALSLFRAGRAPFIAVTGGRRPGDVYTEAEVSATYLEGKGVPERRILSGAGNDTWQNVATVLSAFKAHHIVDRADGHRSVPRIPRDGDCVGSRVSSRSRRRYRTHRRYHFSYGSTT